MVHVDKNNVNITTYQIGLQFSVKARSMGVMYGRLQVRKHIACEDEVSR